MCNGDCNAVSVVVHLPRMSDIAIEGHGRIPEAPVLMAPNRVDLEVLKALEKTLGGMGRISWLVDSALLPSADIRRYVGECGADGILADLSGRGREEALARIEAKLASGRHVVLLPGRPVQCGAMLADVPAAMLSFVDDLRLRVQPVFVGMYNDCMDQAVASSAPHASVRIEFLPPLECGPHMSSRVRSAWMEASADDLMRHPRLVRSLLPQALMEGLMNHPDARVIDGVDDSPLTYREILRYAVLLAGYFRKRHNGRRLGIILPPGKLAVISNLACLFAGISAVNMNYTVSESVFRKQVALAGITRFVTEERFVSKLQGFSWPRGRDLVFVERALGELRNTAGAFWLRFGGMKGARRMMRRFHLEDGRAETEASLVFTGGFSGDPKAVPLTYRMLMSSVLQVQSRLGLRTGDAVLSAMPLFHGVGLTLGMLLPLAYGCDIVTYPSLQASRRLCELVKKYSVRLAVSTPLFARRMLEKASPDSFERMEYLITVGEKTPRELIEEAARRFRVRLLSGYGLAEVASLVALNSPPPVSPEKAAVLPSAAMEAVGAPMPGVAVRIADVETSEPLLAPRALGVIWLRGANVLSGYLGSPEASAANLRDQWFRTGDIGMLSEHGLLYVYGRKPRFSKVGGEMVSHELVERVVYRVLKTDPAVSGRKLVVVGVPASSGGEEMVLLSSLHRHAFANDLITLRYGIMNEGYPAAWCPSRILPTENIPVLPNGELDYPACLALARRRVRN